MDICGNLHVFSMSRDLCSQLKLEKLGTSPSSFAGDEHEDHLSSDVFGRYLRNGSDCCASGPFGGTEVTLTGTVSCARCQGLQPMHKGYTQFSWALYSVSQGDDVVLVVQDKTYTLQGDKDQILKFMSAKARVTGHLEGATLQVTTIGHPTKNDEVAGN